MPKERIIGREEEIRRLKDCYESPLSQLIVLYGRRRVGKSFLVNQTFKDKFDFKLVGDYTLTKEAQLLNFHKELERKSKKTLSVPKDWNEAFWLLRDYLDFFKDKKSMSFFLMKCRGWTITNRVSCRHLSIFGTVSGLRKITLCLLPAALPLHGWLSILTTIRAVCLIARTAVYILNRLRLPKQKNF